MGLLNRTALLSILKAHFNDSEMRDLCFDLYTAYEDLGGEGRTDKARALIEYAERHERINSGDAVPRAGATGGLASCGAAPRPP